ncbi:glycoside hydrolase family 16 protein [Macrolepiota fuliginosa MF-IS2]|uniref:Glycoside hydrolase family 16 protein n=1 Tax=Macrolepiota fuliginosa MF-IS2 TaxID=1400762 RepID=A0A9P6BVJ3_9AGAR|nr:glycoside hydrolase family 16 protein [Macrolepiota fuliginosa MF-IS2]
MFSALRIFALMGVLGAAGVRGAQYGLAKDYSGPSFFNDWVFYDHFDDTMNGDTIFVSAANASSQHLAFVDPGTNRAIIKVDNTSFVPFNQKRDSVRISTKDTFGIGTVWVVDMWHAPFGCSVWPALWTFSPGAQWPAGGEIDIFEGINLHPTSQMGLHTTPGCTQVSPQQTSKIVNGTDCQGAAGCIVTNDNPASYGPAFAQANGGVFVTELAESGVSIWFFERANIPAGLTNNASTVDTSTLGTPMGNWPSGGCDISKFFLQQTLVFDITFCGDFAGSPQFFPQTCSGVCYTDYVINNGTSQYANAYFDVGYVRVFSSNVTGSGSGSGGNGTSSGGAGSSGSSGGMPRLSVFGGIGGLVAGVVMVVYCLV